MPKLLDIAEVSKITGIRASTLRFYDEKGLIRPCGRRGLRRLFNSSVIQRLAVISLGQRSGFSLEEIALLFASSGKINRNMLLAKVDELDTKIKELSSMSRGLRHASVCTASSHFECPKFLRLLRIAERKRSKQGPV